MNYQHGDVLIRGITSLPDGLTKLGENDVVVAEGEQTGHHHRVQGQVALYERPNKTMVMEVKHMPAFIFHEEHKPIEIIPGVYEIGRVQEYDYFEEMARQVQD